MWLTEMAGYALGLMTLVALVGVYCDIQLYREIEKSHPSQWKEMGNPKLFAARSFRRELQWIVFIILRRYRNFGNPRVSLMGDLVFICGIINLAILVSWAFIPDSADWQHLSAE